MIRDRTGRAQSIMKKGSEAMKKLTLASQQLLTKELPPWYELTEGEKKLCEFFTCDPVQGLPVKIFSDIAPRQTRMEHIIYCQLYSLSYPYGYKICKIGYGTLQKRLPWYDNFIKGEATPTSLNGIKKAIRLLQRNNYIFRLTDRIGNTGSWYRVLSVHEVLSERGLKNSLLQDLSSMPLSGIPLSSMPLKEIPEKTRKAVAELLEGSTLP
jgi:hypothetical protein